MQWDVVIGLEVHVQLSTCSKIFSGASTAFGAEPNTQACGIDLGLPGTLPVLNESAVAMAVRFGLAINAEIPEYSVFERKNYFYPDLPKGYQTSQMAHPVVGRGEVDITLGDGTVKTVRIHHAHMEEDAGKSLHEDYSGMTGIDLNRAGTPLLEIVSEPDMHSAEEASAYIRAIHAIVTYLGISDGNMAEGSMRCDVNVSLRPKGQEKLGTRAEIKNVNSFRFVERAIAFEIERQREILEDGGVVIQETRLYNPDLDETRSMRTKEEANDYRYFPCPDLLPLMLDEAYIEHQRSLLPELPSEKRQRFVESLGLSTYDADVLTGSRPLAEYFEAVQQHCSDAKLAANWVQGDLLGRLNRDGLDITESPVSAEQLGGLLVRLVDDTINGKAAKQVFADLWECKGETADDIIESRGLKQVTDTGAIESLCDQVIADNPVQVTQYREATEDKRGKMIGFFVGQVMKASRGTANPPQVNAMLTEKLDALL
ncbi:Asp-tRNA(Asn)/Glu-tRNA(Gln) amidotransferase subunit GatB [Kushneria phyllosphaerae]|uniref:Aspartyl/glutamyl-tRNA(Asn/Gln) amidotransferase subunit B n=1 Tax=Kushneria phyllosphaerae TaxID=2100822 RepID=A0A2R8CQN7_9GAMM|nr:Asp-tRNA(Asn)/Glu-tRNA(Gln) amidotransferase subunit GatB [Kushneria phyllosphaerae]SPJ35104.1 Aspartyl/glutamyl-tRNA(Asn/Gln) amidotransferase subunit B [Kushneria phyllosphaerae]